MLGTSNGLVCLADYLHFSFILWNPTVRKYVLLPRLTVTRKPSVGFGFDRRSNDFKVVNLVHHDGKLDTAWVYSYATWSWKPLTNSTPPPCFVLNKTSHVFINGVFHWIASRRRRHSVRHYKFILTLDPASEVFGEILLPRGRRIIEDTWFASTSLAMSEDNRIWLVEISTVCWSVWVMKQYGVLESWTNVVTTRELIPRDVLAIRKNGDMILQMKRGQILRYNPTTTTNVWHDGGDFVFMGFHVESLYLLEKRDEVMSY